MRKSKAKLTARASKRKHERELVSPSEPKPKRISKKMESEQRISTFKADKYCWMCHSEADEKTCETCHRTFHDSCLNKASMSFSEYNVCHECQAKSVNGTELNSSKYLSLDKVKQMLDILTRRSFEKKREKNSKFLAWPEEHRDNLFKIIDFGILLDNINQFGTYTKPVEFYADVKFIYHNSCIIYGINSDQAKAADSLRKDFEKELLDLEACPECYYYMYCDNLQNPFARICDSPHDIIWAQLTGHPYWPAKCLKVLKGTVGYVAHVRFFGKHEQSDLPIGKCLFISESHPKYKNSGPKAPLYKAAKAELLEYICLYRRKFGNFQFYPHKTLYKPEEKRNEVPVLPTEVSCNRHLAEMKREGNTYEESEPYVINVRIEDSEDNTTFQNMTNDIPTPIGSGTEGQYPSIAEINPSLEPDLSSSEDNIKKLSAVTSINMTFSTDENNFGNINPVVTSISSLPPTDISSSVQSSPNTSVFVDNALNATSTQSNSLPNIESDFSMDTGSQDESEEEIQYIGKKKQGDYNPDVVLPMLMRANPKLKDLVEQTRYFSDAMIVQLYASFGGSSYVTEKLSKLHEDLKKCEMDLKNAIENNDKLRKDNETHKYNTQGLTDSLLKAEADVRELESQIEIQKVKHNEKLENACVVINTMQNRVSKKVLTQMKAEHSTNLKKKEDLIIKKDEIIAKLEEENKCLKKEFEECKSQKQKAEDELKTTKKKISPDTLSEYKRMHYCCVCERIAGKTCCLNTSYCSDECEAQHAEVHRKNCEKTQLKSQTLVQQTVVREQSVVRVSSHGIVQPGRSSGNNHSHSVSEARPSGSAHSRKPQIHHISASPLLPTPHYPSAPASSRSYSKHKRRSNR